MSELAIAAAPASRRALALWYDGRLVGREEMYLDPMTHGLHYGTGVFEGIRSYETPEGLGLFRLREHMERFHRSAAAYGLRVPYDVESLCNAILETVKAAGGRSVYVRPLAYFGEESIVLHPASVCATHVFIAILPFGGIHSETAQRGLRCTISRTWRKTPSRSLPATVKGAGHYANSVLAMQDGVRAGFDEVILLNDRDEIAEGTGENVFYVRDGVLYTNDATADILLGITRQTVLDLAADLGIRSAVQPMRERDLLAADEVFLTGTAAGIVPVASLDDRRYPAERRVTDRLMAAYDRATAGEDPRHRDWVTLVPAM